MEQIVPNIKFILWFYISDALENLSALQPSAQQKKSLVYRHESYKYVRCVYSDFGYVLRLERQTLFNFPPFSLSVSILRTMRLKAEKCWFDIRYFPSHIYEIAKLYVETKSKLGAWTTQTSTDRCLAYSRKIVHFLFIDKSAGNFSGCKVSQKFHNQIEWHGTRLNRLIFLITLIVNFLRFNSDFLCRD